MAKLNQLTGLRFIAAVAVFFYHFEWDPNSSWIAKIIAEGYIGVSFLFVLSGFVVSYSYKDRILGGSIGFRSYALLRLARIAPLHVLTALPFFSLYIDNWREKMTLFLNIFMLQSWLPFSKIYFSLNSPSWSLSNEIFFYMIFGALVYLSFRGLRVLFAILITTICAAALLMPYFFANDIALVRFSISYWMFNIFPAFRLVEFVSGMLIYEAWTRGYRPRREWFMIAVIFLGFAMHFGSFVPDNFRHSLFYLPFVSFLLFSSLRVDAFGLRWSSSDVAVFLGNASFGIYLFHLSMVPLLLEVPFFTGLGPAGFVVFSFLAVVALSSFVYLVFERPLERYLRQKILSSQKTG